MIICRLPNGRCLAVCPQSEDAIGLAVLDDSLNVDAWIGTIKEGGMMIWGNSNNALFEIADGVSPLLGEAYQLTAEITVGDMPTKLTARGIGVRFERCAADFLTDLVRLDLPGEDLSAVIELLALIPREGMTTRELFTTAGDLGIRIKLETFTID